MSQLVYSSKLFANGDLRLLNDIQVELPHFSYRDLYLLPVHALISTKITMRAKNERELLLAIPMRVF